MNMTANDPRGRMVTFSIRSEAYFKLANLRGNTVDIVVNGIILFSKTPTLDIEVTASPTEGGLTGTIKRCQASHSTRKVTVIVLHTNNYAPVFESETKHLVIFQRTSIGTTYRNIIQVTDMDSGKNAEQVITCNATITPACAFFNITYERNGEGEFSVSITVAADLNYAHAQSYTLAIQSTDQGTPPKTTTENFLITIQDTEGKPPVFDTVSFYRVSMNERLPVGTNVANITAWDGDTGIRRPVNISIVNDTLGLFDTVPLTESEGRYTSALFTKRLVIRESVGGTYWILLQATEIAVNDTGEDAYVNSTSLVGVLFVIIPTNNYPPRCDGFNSPIEVTNLHVADRIPGVLIRCFDKDEPPYNSFKLGIVNDTGILKLTRETAEKEVYARLVVINETAFAKATGAVILICVMAQEDIGNIQQRKNFSDTVCMTITVYSTSESNPVFDSSFYQITIDVSTAPHTVIITVHATDSSSAVSYSLMGPESEKFAINATTGQVSLTTSMAQSSASLIGLQVVATNGFGRSAFVDFQVILDSGAQSSFEHSFYNTRVIENSTVLDPPITVKVIGPTSDKLIYTIASGSQNGLFTIEPHTGRLGISRPLRWHDGRQFSLHVTAKDTYNSLLLAQDQATVEITLLQQNLRAPFFSSSLYTVSISENAPIGAFITRITASDGDDPDTPYGQVTYLLRFGNTNIFRINPNDGIISLITSLDQRMSNNYTLVVLAQDGGSPPLSALTTVTVSIVLSNTRPPVFKQGIYIVDIGQEMLSEGTRLVQVEATVLLPNVSVRYGIETGSYSANQGLQAIDVPASLKDTIAIDKNLGIVYLARNFNNIQDITFVKFKVTALAVNGQVSKADVQIYIRSGTGRLAAPVFLNRPWIRYNDDRIFANMTEQLTGIATKLVAYNPASNSQLVTFREIASSNNDPYDMFTVSAQGEVLLTKSVDVDALLPSDSGLSVLVEAIGETNLTSTASVTVSVLRMGTSAPRFLHDTYACRVRQNAVAESKVCDVAIDTSGIGYSPIGLQYSLQGLLSNHFYVDQQGTVRVATSSELLGKDVSYNYNIMIVASKLNGMAATAKLSIAVEPVNLNSPACLSNPFYFFASVDSEVGSIIGSVIAIDADHGQSVSYQSADPLFLVNPTNGDVSLLKLLPQKQINYSFAIVATDNGNQSRQAVCSVIVSTLLPTLLTDSVIFISPASNDITYKVQRPEAGTCVATLRAVYRNDIIEYRLVNTTGSNNFFINNLSKLCLSRSLDIRDGRVYELIVTAKAPVRSSSRRVRIQLEDQPAFDQCLPETLVLTVRHSGSRQNIGDRVNVSLGTAAECTVGSITLLTNQTSYYGIIPCDKSNEAAIAAALFWINSTTGDIYLAPQANLIQLRGIAPFCVYISSTYQPASILNTHWWNTRRVQVILSSKPSHEVRFSQHQYTAVLSADVPVSTAIICVRESDFSHNNTYSLGVIYLVRNGSMVALTNREAVPLRIDHNTGIVYTTLLSYVSYIGGWYRTTMLLVDESGAYNDTAVLLVYIAPPLSQLILVFGPSFNWTLLEEFYSSINVNTSDNKLRYSFITEKIRSHVDPVSLVVYSNMSDVFVRMVDLIDSRLLTLQEEIDFFSQLDSAALADLLRRYPGLSAYNSNGSIVSLPGNFSWPPSSSQGAAQFPGNADSLQMVQGAYGWGSDDSWLWWVAIAAALILFLETVILCVCLCCIWGRYHGYSSRIYDIRLSR